MRIRTTILAGAFLLATGSAAAVEGGVQSGFYLGLGIGKSKANLESGDFTLNGALSSREAKEETDTGYKAMAGWRLGRYFAVELAYADLGKYAYQYTLDLGAGDRTSRINYKATSWSASAIGTIPVKGDLSALLRLGLTSNRAERSGLQGEFFVTPPGYSGASKRRTSVLWGAGGQYDITPKTSVRLEFENYGHFGEAKTNSVSVGFPAETGQAKVWMWSLSGIYVF